MEDDRRVWPSGSGPRHRRTSGADGDSPWDPRRPAPEKPPWDPGRPAPEEPLWDPRRPAAGGAWPPEEADPPWNPQRTPRAAPAAWDEEEPADTPLPWESLPPSARFYGAPKAPGGKVRARGRRWRRRTGGALALVVAGALVAGLVALLLRVAVPEPADSTLTDTSAGVTIPLPPGWREGPVPPVTGFTSVARDDAGALVMARPFSGVPADVKEAAELYSKLLLHGDTVTVIEDRAVAHGTFTGQSRSLRAEYKDVVNRPVYLRVTHLTRGGRGVLLIGLLQPDETARRQALDAVLSGVR